jgi:hypothetical protein
VRKVLVRLHLKGIAYEIDPIVPFLGDDRFSRLSPLRRILAHEAFQRLAPFEELSLRTPVAEQRKALVERGALLAAESFGTATPRRGVMSI